PRIVQLIGNAAFWIAILVSAEFAARVARLDTFSDWLDRIVEYVPTLLAGGLIAIAGYLLSTLVRDAVAATVASPGSDQGRLLALTAQGAVFVTAIVIGLDQIGVDVTFLITLVSIVVGGALIAMALAFGLGARDLVSNLIASHYARQTVAAGDLVRIGDIEGRVVEITPTAVIVMTSSGRSAVPSKLLQQQVVAFKHADGDD
ncbi:MAG: mechanosensitive ion channel, partial [Gammaproteobacteria bacterium]|nr:mechanosensitive ion channel [Gammaproteobacteria bacterium]